MPFKSISHAVLISVEPNTKSSLDEQIKKNSKEIEKCKANIGSSVFILVYVTKTLVCDQTCE